ncbi:Piso0_003285 [Millerozyma farinosa CBS 7064]|uniref:Piso0_003285 protein n=1 Tax=Pichia sorbitophila (strain ATCC MYA-4447 / BCRC 22081 / CBS 7064 / NBRC 10061 / NRRL Y-12695) TaxID=559304 RepID=G8YIN8_PICSO|nr:Piso0_003285 [Millerozyma farinosa CBS 7064]CCE80948.1 Piso0_003285 [Millerozyma farinosa CBS 7064]
MGIKKMFKRKEPTEEELREDLNRVGISTKSGKGREEKFGAFKQYAQERSKAKPGFKPVNPYASINGNAGGGSNPYAQPQDQENGQEASPYDSAGVNEGSYSGGAAGSSPYARETNRQRPSSAQQGGFDPYSRTTTRERVESKQQPDNMSSRGSIAPSTRSYARRPRDADEETLDLNSIPTNDMTVSRKPVRRNVGDDDFDLNDLPEEDDLNVELDELPEEKQVDSEDEAVEAIKQDIRFVKQESVASTRNTLRMAQESDASATNTMGMLGSQSERLYNAEQNLLLADTQTKIADEKVKELQRLNRSIFIPAYGNPFNKKSRLRQQEEKIKSNKSREKYLRETNRHEMYESEQRIKQGLTNNATSSDIYQKYQGERSLDAARRYQFENDSEDDEMEKEIANNLDQIGLYAKKLKGSANTIGKEVDSQNTRLRTIEDDADRLDIDVHMNSTRLNNIH